MLGQAHSALLRKGSFEMTISKQSIAQTPTAFRSPSKVLYVNRGCRSGCLDNCVTESIGCAQRRRGSYRSVASNLTDRYSLPIGERRYQRYDTIMRKVRACDLRVSREEYCVSLKLD